jgi:hypothetical protein
MSTRRRTSAKRSSCRYAASTRSRILIARCQVRSNVESSAQHDVDCPTGVMEARLPTEQEVLGSIPRSGS